MWIIFNDGFVSIVDKARNRERDLVVRARRPGDLEAIFGVKVTTTPRGDYRYRAEVPRAKVAEVVAARIAGIAYDNFKDSVADKPLHDAYSRFWSIMGDLQPGGPYNAGRGRSLFDLHPMPEDKRHDICECGAGFARYLLDAGRLVCDGCSRGAA